MIIAIRVKVFWPQVVLEGNGDGHHGCFANLAVNIRESREKRNLAHL